MNSHADVLTGNLIGLDYLNMIVIFYLVIQ